MPTSPARAPAGEVWHFSEDPAIAVFAPHVAATAAQPEPYVWAVNGSRCPDYWFPRQCPRAMAWRGPGTDTQVADRLLGSGVQRVHVIEYPWLPVLMSATVYAYPFDVGDFRPFGDPPHAHVTEREVEPLRPPLAVPDLVAQHERAGIELRVVTDLFGWWHDVVASDLEFSGIRPLTPPPRPLTSRPTGGRSAVAESTSATSCRALRPADGLGSPVCDLLPDCGPAAPPRAFATSCRTFGSG